MAKPTAVLPLRFASLEEIARSTGLQDASPQPLFPLWLAIVFPKLLLEVLIGDQPEQAAIVIEEVKGQPLVYAASAAAEHSGINAGMALGAAYALCPHVKVFRYDAHVESRRLEQLALWAVQFTSKLSVQPPDALLLEVRGSLKYFGGLKKLLTRIREDITAHWQHQHHMAVSPTPAASLLLARSGQAIIVNRKEKLRSALGPLPIRLLPLNDKQLKQLYNTGVRVLRDLWRLPKDGLARRFGADLVRYLDASLGLFPDVRRELKWPESFVSRREWGFEVGDTALLMDIARELLEELAHFLRNRDACISQCEFFFQHTRLPSTTVVIGVRQPTRDAGHLLLLLQEHLNRTTLPAPAIGTELQATDLHAYTARSDALFLFPNEPVQQNTVSVDLLLERLQARVGREAIQAVCARADHRPEYAHGFADKAEPPPAELVRYRPLWLLSVPQPLSKRRGKIWHQGPLSIVQGPERIESGWWSGDDVCRDYYIAVNGKGSRLWVFKDLKSQDRWFLHGLFA
ncbi:MAG: DNA polymerase Y family protein [Gammaproteobacteria bacterium]|jgi:protein ImuB|nr:DNA polymerase Y family protein [Gammaproteobacteria bacterium]